MARPAHPLPDRRASARFARAAHPRPALEPIHLLGDADCHEPPSLLVVSPERAGFLFSLVRAAALKVAPRPVPPAHRPALWRA